jgi:hypothetical protein
MPLRVGHVRYPRSDGTFLGDAHGDAVNGYNPEDLSEYTDDMSLRVESVVHSLKQALTLLFERMHNDHATDQENAIKLLCVYGSREEKALSGIRMIERWVCGFGIFHKGLLEKLYRDLKRFHFYASWLRTQARHAQQPVDQLFNYMQLVEECIALCSETIIVTAPPIDVRNPYYEHYGGGYNASDGNPSEG